MCKEMWIAAEEEISYEFYETFGRDPTEKELEALMVDGYSDYVGGLIDHVMMMRVR